MSRLQCEGKSSSSSQKQACCHKTQAESPSKDALNTEVTGGTALAPPPVESLPRHELNEEEEQTEENAKGDDLKAPLEMIVWFLRAVMNRDFPLAFRLCQMILIYEPDNPEASEFLPLIQQKLLAEQEAANSNKEDKEDDGSDDDDGSDEESCQSSSCSSSSSSSSSSSDDDEDEEKQ